MMPFHDFQTIEYFKNNFIMQIDFRKIFYHLNVSKLHRFKKFSGELASARN